MYALVVVHYVVHVYIHVYGDIQYIRDIGDGVLTAVEPLESWKHGANVAYLHIHV